MNFQPLAREKINTRFILKTREKPTTVRSVYFSMNVNDCTRFRKRFSYRGYLIESYIVIVGHNDLCQWLELDPQFKFRSQPTHRLHRSRFHWRRQCFVDQSNEHHRLISRLHSLTLWPHGVNREWLLRCWNIKIATWSPSIGEAGLFHCTRRQRPTPDWLDWKLLIWSTQWL